MADDVAHKWDGMYWLCLDCATYSADPCNCECCKVKRARSTGNTQEPSSDN